MKVDTTRVADLLIQIKNERKLLCDFNFNLVCLSLIEHDSV